jgi:hypothetical protein
MMTPEVIKRYKAFRAMPEATEFRNSDSEVRELVKNAYLRGYADGKTKREPNVALNGIPLQDTVIKRRFA